MTSTPNDGFFPHPSSSTSDFPTSDSNPFVAPQFVLSSTASSPSHGHPFLESCPRNDSVTVPATSSTSSPIPSSISVPNSVTDHSSSLAHHSPALRRSSRATGPPTSLQDYHCPHKATSAIPSQSTSFTSFANPYPLFTYANLAHLSPIYMASLTKVLQIPKPHSYFQTQLYLEWLMAMNQELNAL